MQETEKYSKKPFTFLFTQSNIKDVDKEVLNKWRVES